MSEPTGHHPGVVLVEHCVVRTLLLHAKQFNGYYTMINSYMLIVTDYMTFIRTAPIPS